MLLRNTTDRLSESSMLPSETTGDAVASSSSPPPAATSCHLPPTTVCHPALPLPGGDVPLRPTVLQGMCLTDAQCACV